jgi:hypothetical protein
MPHIYSTLSSGMKYCQYAKGGADLPVVEKQVYIKGGTGIRAEHNGKDMGITTPVGIVTEIAEEELAILEANPVFKIHKENGFIVVVNEPKKTLEKASAPSQMEKVTENMSKKDKSAQKVPEDFMSKEGPKFKPLEQL